MPRVPDVLLNSISYLYPDRESADAGAEVGGSGFLLFMYSEKAAPACHLYAVTNRHVITDGCATIRVNLRLPNSDNERAESLPFASDSWILHPEHDLAVRPFPPDYELSTVHAITLLDVDALMTQEFFNAQDVGPGDDLFYVGRFRDHAGKYSNMPSVRFGNISMNPDEREPLEYEIGGRVEQQVAFLVEARSRAGYSGSPVFYYVPTATNMPRWSLVLSARYSKTGFKILGVDCGHLSERVDLFHYPDQKPLQVQAAVHSGMMAVVPAWYLKDFLLTSPSLVEQRALDDAHYKKHPIKVTSESD